MGNTNVFLTATNSLFNSNAFGTNLIIQAIRPGINKFQFKKVDFDSGIGQTLIPTTNRYTDTAITNGRPVIQALQRVSIQPDFLFVVQDLGLGVGGIPFTAARTGTANWQNNDLINGFSNLGGPGVITPQVTVTFSDVLPYFLNSVSPELLDDQTAFGSFIWASFDGTTNAPVIYPQYGTLTLQSLTAGVLGGR